MPGRVYTNIRTISFVRHAIEVIVLMGLSAGVWAQVNQNPLNQQTQQDQAKQAEEQLKRSQQAERVSGANGAASQTSWRNTKLAAETPCFTLNEITLEGTSAWGQFGFVSRYLHRYQGRCVGEAGLKQILVRTTDRIITSGYVTTQVKLKAQNVRTGHLEVVLIPGRLEGFKFAKGSPKINWHSAFGVKRGDVLNVRALEQGLEQIKAVNSQDVHMSIEPGEQPGTSYVVLEVSKTKPWRVNLSANNDGFNSTGKDQGSANLQWDELLHLNDTLSVTYGHSLELNHGHFGSANLSGDERMAWGMWTLDLSAGDYHFYQNLLGGTEIFRSTGDSQSYGIHLSRVVHRTATSRITASFNLDARQAYNYIDNTIIAVQTRHTRSVTAELAERKYLGRGQLDANVSYQHGVPWFKGQWDPATANALIPRFDYQRWQSDIGFSRPFGVHKQSLMASSSVHAQYSPDRLYGENYIAIGGPYSVRGFAGDISLAADDGYYLRNQLNWQLPQAREAARLPKITKLTKQVRPSLYLGLDEGGVYGPDFPYAKDHVLMGYCIGTSGVAGRHLQWDFSAAKELVQPGWFGNSGRTVVKGSFSVSI